MLRKLLCRIFRCAIEPMFYSARIGENQGFDNPEPITGLPGWSVYKFQQTEIYKITHNLGLINPGQQAKIIAIPCDPDVRLVIAGNSANSFELETWKDVQGGPVPAATDIIFVFVKYN